MTTVFVLFFYSHVDCYKRSESGGNVVGVFDTKSKAIKYALDNEFNDFELDDAKFTDPIMIKYLKNRTYPKTEKLQSDLFDNLCNHQLKLQGEFTRQSSGNFYEIVETKMKS